MSTLDRVLKIVAEAAEPSANTKTEAGVAIFNEMKKRGIPHHNHGPDHNGYFVKGGAKNYDHKSFHEMLTKKHGFKYGGQVKSYGGFTHHLYSKTPGPYQDEKVSVRTKDGDSHPDLIEHTVHKDRS